MTPTLTVRQREVAALVAEGYSRAEVATLLRCELETVRSHLREISVRLPGSGKLRRRICAWAAAERAAQRQRAA